MLRPLLLLLVVVTVVPAMAETAWMHPCEHQKFSAASFGQPSLDNSPNPRYTLLESAPGKILDFNDTSILYTGSDGTFIHYRDGRPDVLIPIGEAFLSTQTSFLTPLGAVVVTTGSQPTIHEYYGENTTYPDIRSVTHTGDYGVFISPVENRSFLRNFRANTNLIIPLPLFSAAVTSNGIVYLSAFNTPEATNTTLYKLDSGDLTQLAPETNHVQGKIQTDGTNVLWFTAPFTLDSNGFQIYLLTPTGRVQLATNYVPPYSVWIEEPGLAQMQNGWTIFPTLDEKGTNQVWRRSPDGTITQATAFPHHTAPFTLRSDGAFAAIVFDSGRTFRHLYFISPISPSPPPLDLGQQYATDFRFIGDELFGFEGNHTLSIDVTHPNPTRIYLPTFNSGTFSCYVTSAQWITTFVFQHSTDLQNWSDISTNLTATPQPKKFEFPAPTGFIRTRQSP